MKKIILIVFMSIIIIICSLFLVKEINKYNDEVKNNKNLANEIDKIKNDINTVNTNITNYEEEIETLKTKHASELKEQQIWKNMKEKLSQSLS